VVSWCVRRDAMRCDGMRCDAILRGARRVWTRARRADGGVHARYDWCKMFACVASGCMRGCTARGRRDARRRWDRRKPWWWCEWRFPNARAFSGAFAR
jgi:hypothetical protein